MNIDAKTTGDKAAAALIGGLGETGVSPPSTLTKDQQAAVTTAVEVLLAQAGIVDVDPVEVHLSSSPEGKWAVLRVASVLEV